MKRLRPTRAGQLLSILAALLALVAYFVIWGLKGGR